MTLTPALRKANFLAHITASLGWLGAVVAYLALAIAGLKGKDFELARSAYVSMELVGWAVIVPMAVATLLTGLVQSLGTEWGLLRHYWVAAKFVLATAGSLILLTHMRVVGQMSGVARAISLTDGSFGGLRVQLVVHAIGGLILLVAATALSIYKPWGLTPYGKREQVERATTPSSNSLAGRGRYLLLGIFGLIVLLLILHHLAGGGLRHH